MAGCFQGMRVEGNSEEVGLKTTAAVVQAIFLVIVLDAFSSDSVPAHLVATVTGHSRAALQ